MTGIDLVTGESLIRRVATHPSSTGRFRSIRITSGGRHDGVALPRQTPRQHVAVLLVVLDEEDLGHDCSAAESGSILHYADAPASSASASSSSLASSRSCSCAT